jgi:monoamine oxidase
MVQIIGGMDQLPNAFLSNLQGCIELGAEMVALNYTSDTVTVHYRHGEELRQESGDYAIITLPYPALRFVDVLKSFSPGKQIAIRQLNYLNAVKVFIECRRRFWEEDDGIFGGITTTDLPIQQIVYPEHGRETGRGVLIGCYTYDREARRWAALPAADRIAQTLKYLSQIHLQVTAEFETGTSKVWGEDKFAGGAFAIFEPSQQELLYSSIIAAEGPVHFAGEHASLKHSWIEGAVESGLRAAQEVHEAASARIP